MRPCVNPKWQQRNSMTAWENTWKTKIVFRLRGGIWVVFGKNMFFTQNSEQGGHDRMVRPETLLNS